MTTDCQSERPSAKIYQFPKGGRRGVEANRQQMTVAETAPRVTGSSFGAWYHEAAIQDSAIQDSKRQ